jgi:chemotaxis protein methyltransferase CheR
MIYFDNETKNRLVNKMYDTLEYGGYFFIGHSEALNKDASMFKYVKPSIYRKE